jgi:hypothetical protein
MMILYPIFSWHSIPLGLLSSREARRLSCYLFINEVNAINGCASNTDTDICTDCTQCHIYAVNAQSSNDLDYYS